MFVPISYSCLLHLDRHIIVIILAIDGSEETECDSGFDLIIIIDTYVIKSMNAVHPLRTYYNIVIVL